MGIRAPGRIVFPGSKAFFRLHWPVLLASLPVKLNCNNIGTRGMVRDIVAGHAPHLFPRHSQNGQPCPMCISEKPQMTKLV